MKGNTLVFAGVCTVCLIVNFAVSSKVSWAFYMTIIWGTLLLGRWYSVQNSIKRNRLGATDNKMEKEMKRIIDVQNQK